MIEDYPMPDEWHLHSAGSSRGVTFRCDFIGDVDSALEEFKRSMRSVVNSWPKPVTTMTITIG